MEDFLRHQNLHVEQNQLVERETENHDEHGRRDEMIRRRMKRHSMAFLFVLQDAKRTE